MKWEEQISDPKDRKVLEALSDPAWDFRTIPGLSEETGLSEFEIQESLERYSVFVWGSI